MIRNSIVFLCFSTLWPSSLPAQDIDICDLYRDAGIPISNCRVDGSTFSFTINACRSLDFIIDGEANTLTVDGRTFDVTLDGILDYGQYIQDICGGFSSAVPVGTPTDPVIQQSIQAIQSRLYSNRAVPGEVDGDSEAGPLSLSQLGTSFGTGSFDANGVEGRSSAALLSYAHALPTGYQFGGQFFFNRISLDLDDNDFANSTLNVFVEKAFRLGGFDGSGGLSYTHLFMDSDYSSDDGQTAALFYTGSRDLGGNRVLNLGMNAQQSEVGAYESRLFSLSSLYGMPTTRNSALNFEATLVTTDQEVNGIDLGLDSSFVSTSLIYDYYIGDFVVNVGARKIVGLEGYSNIDYVLSGRLRY